MGFRAVVSVSESLTALEAATIEGIRKAIADYEYPDISRRRIEVESGLAKDTVQRGLTWLCGEGELRHSRVVGNTQMYEPTEEFDHG